MIIINSLSFTVKSILVWEISYVAWIALGKWKHVWEQRLCPQEAHKSVEDHTPCITTMALHTHLADTLQTSLQTLSRIFFQGRVLENKLGIQMFLWIWKHTHTKCKKKKTCLGSRLQVLHKIPRWRLDLKQNHLIYVCMDSFTAKIGLKARLIVFTLFSARPEL